MTINGDNSGIFSTGDHTINIQLGGTPPVRSQYLFQVNRIAPLFLDGREAELANSPRFCCSPTGGYAWCVPMPGPASRP